MAAIIYNTAYMYMYESWYSVISSLHILASGAVVNIILASKHMFLGMGNTFLVSYDHLEVLSIGYAKNQRSGHIGIQIAAISSFISTLASGRLGAQL